MIMIMVFFILIIMIIMIIIIIIIIEDDVNCGNENMIVAVVIAIHWVGCAKKS